MKRHAGLLVAAFLFLLAACANLGSTPEPPPPERNTVPTVVYEEPVYQFDIVTAQNDVSATDGPVLAYYSYQILSLSIPNLDAVSPEDAEAAERNANNFNDRMNALLEESIEIGKIMGEDALEIYELGSAAGTYYDETTVDYYSMGQIVSIRLDNGSYTGGAHPNSYTSSQIFDLGTGQFIDPTQIADDPEAFRDGAAKALLEKAEALESREAFWADYGEIIARWNEGTTIFDEEGMLVIFSRYELGPYSMGTVELRLDYGELAELIGPSGLARLGLAEEEAGKE